MVVATEKRVKEVVVVFAEPLVAQNEWRLQIVVCCLKIVEVVVAADRRRSLRGRIHWQGRQRGGQNQRETGVTDAKSSSERMPKFPGLHMASA